MHSQERHYSSPSYIDAKGRTRFHENDELAEQLKRLGQFLVVGGYPAQHAARYPKLAHTISRHPEPLRQIYEASSAISSIKRRRFEPGRIITDKILVSDECTTSWIKYSPKPFP
jgi:hypothetical protein